ncbi:MAG: hypothetical protein IJY50_07215 [Clostridia bacterium]|nr:hypothetical protein [Clostridia bacterium]
MQYIIMGATVLILVINVLVGLGRGFSRGLLRLLTLLVALVGAFVLAGVLADRASVTLVDGVHEMAASDPQFAAFLEENDIVGDAVGALAHMLAAPILFLVAYIVLKLLTWVVYLILRVCFSVGKPKGVLLNLGGGLCMGLAAGLIGVLVFVTPVMGYTQLFSQTIEQADSLTQRAGDLGLEEYNEQYITPASTAPVASELYEGVGKHLFRSLSSAEWEGEKAYLEDEWFAVIGVADQAAVLVERPVAEYGETESAAIHNMAAGVGQSKMLSAISSGLFNGVSNAWLSNQPFLGVERPQSGDENMDIILNGFFRVFATTDPALIGGDLESFADLFDLMVKYEVFAQISSGEEGDLAAYLVTSGFFDEVKELLDTTPRLEPVAVAISDAGMRVLVRQLGDPANYAETCKELMDDISTTLKAVTDESGQVNTEALSNQLTTVFAEHDVNVDADTTDLIAKGVADEFTPEELTTLTVEEMTDRLIGRLGDVENIDTLIAENAA